MNIIDALKSGQRFRRKNRSFINAPEGSWSCELTKEELLSDDWEIEKTVTITKSELETAFNKAEEFRTRIVHYADKIYPLPTFQEIVTKVLGLEP